MMTARGTSPVKIDAINLGSAGSGNALKSLGEQDRRHVRGSRRDCAGELCGAVT